MRTVEQYWFEFERIGFIKELTEHGVKYSLPPHLGVGGFELWGDTETCMACLSDAIFFKPCIVLESVHEKVLEFGQFYQGDVSFYKKREEAVSIDHGLNYLVNYPLFSGYKRMEPDIRLINAGLAYRQKFFDTLPYTLPEDFWESAASVLNPEPLTIPAITLICDQIRNCRLRGEALKIFIQGKALEAFAITLDYIYANRKEPLVKLSSLDRKALEAAKELLTKRLVQPPQIKELSRYTGLNQQKLMSGFKQLNGITIYEYIKRARMQKAFELLLASDMSIMEIAKDVGYHGDGHFHQVFREVYGTTPGKLRKTIQDHENRHENNIAY